MQVPRIRSRFKSTEGLLRNMLDNFLHVQSLIVQKTKLIDDCAHLLMSGVATALTKPPATELTKPLATELPKPLATELTKPLLPAFAFISSESDADKRRFCVACVSALETHLQGRTPVFLLQELSKIMCPVKTLPIYLLILTKSPSQEEYIRGTMTKNPYVSSDIGLVMRDVKRKICLDLDMAGLMDDENGMRSSYYYYICVVRVLLYVDYSMCVLVLLYVSSYYCVCVLLIPVYMCARAGMELLVRGSIVCVLVLYICVLVLLYMCPPHASICVLRHGAAGARQHCQP